MRIYGYNLPFFNNFGFFMTKKIILKVFVFLVLSFLVAKWICSLPERAIVNDPQVSMTVKTGEALFWGKATCHVCHRIGEHGYALRGPNLGESKEGAVIAERAKLRADSLKLASAANYILQSIAQPNAFLVPGYNNEMPKVYQPPVALYPSEIKAIVFYLLSLAGDSTVSAFELPEAITSYYDAPQKATFKITGDPAAGSSLYFDIHGAAACATCHTAMDAAGLVTGKSVGPDLSAIGLIRSAEHIYRKIIKPDSNIVSGYEDVLIKTKNGRFFTGIIKGEDDLSVVLLDRIGSETIIRKKEIAKRLPQKISNMPMNYAELLTEKQIQDLVAFLATLKHSGKINLPKE